MPAAHPLLHRARRHTQLALTHLGEHHALDAATTSDLRATVRDIDQHEHDAQALVEQSQHDLESITTAATTRGCPTCTQLRTSATNLHNELEQLT